MLAPEGAVAPGEFLTRFLTSSNHLGGGRVKHPAFMPKTGETTLSVFRIDKLGERNIWQLGESAFRHSGKNLRGRGDLGASHVYGLKLAITPDDVPARHAHIGGFPLEKAERKQIALELAAAATLVLKP